MRSSIGKAISSEALKRTISWSLIGGVVGSLIGFAIDLWPRRQDLWEQWVTGEWRGLEPLLAEREEEEQRPDIEIPTELCRTCHGLNYNTPHRYEPLGEWKLRTGRGFDRFFKDSSTTYPRIDEWVHSAIQGCVSCQLVVDAVSVYSPQIFRDYDRQLEEPSPERLHIRAFPNPGKPLTVVICRPWITWHSDREEYLEVFTDIGKDLNTVAWTITDSD
jgi:hypothetical protein